MCGSRDWPDPWPIRATLDGLLARYSRLVVVHGACPTGADAMASAWCDLRRGAVDERRHPAHWRHRSDCEPGCRKVTGKPAGMARNREMLEVEHPAVVLAWRADGESPGTDGMLTLAKAADVPAYVTRRG